MTELYLLLVQLQMFADEILAVCPFEYQDL